MTEAEIRIDDRIVTPRDIDREMQYHPARDLAQARRQAALALSVRALLLGEADRLGIRDEATAGPDSAEDERIARLLERELSIPEPQPQECLRYYERNRERFRGPGRYRVSHIFRPAPNDDADARFAARDRCRRLIRVSRADPERFARLARRYSRCPSAGDGGRLGEIGPGQTCREFDQALDRLPVGEVAPHPVETRYGFHVVWLHDRTVGEPLPFDQVHTAIQAWLQEASWRRALSQYLKILAARAAIRGIDLGAADSPLVQ